MKEVTITRDRFHKLLKAQAKLDCLRNGGVDNWEWYDTSLENMPSDEDIESEISAEFGE